MKTGCYHYALFPKTYVILFKKKKSNFLLMEKFCLLFLIPLLVRSYISINICQHSLYYCHLF